MGTLRLRIERLEAALLLFVAVLSGEPADATPEERAAMQAECSNLLSQIRDEPK